MQLTRVIPRLDIKGTNVVKPVQYDGLRVLGNVTDFARKYSEQGADEILALDVVASLYRRKFQIEVVREIAKSINVPLTFGGGITCVNDIRELLGSGVDKVAINTAATKNPKLLYEAAQQFGAQCIVSQIDYFVQDSGKIEVWTDGGKEISRYTLMDWAKTVQDQGVGEIILSCINADGLGKGYELENLQAVSEMVSVPVIASCGAGSKQDLIKPINIGKAHAVSAASIFHYEIAKQITRSEMLAELKPLRKGQSLDIGEKQFLCEGYGGLRKFPVEPCTILQAKGYMLENEIKVRMI